MESNKTNKKLADLEKLYNEKNILQLSAIHSIFLNLEENDFIEYTNHIFKNNNNDQINLFLFFLILFFFFFFKHIPKVQEILNSQKIPLNLIERLILFSHYFYFKKDEKNIIKDIIFYFLNQDRLLNLLINSENIANDIVLIFTILIQFDAKHIDDYFNKGKNIKMVVHGFTLLPNELIKDILFHNVILFDYLLSIMPIYITEKAIKDFSKKYSGEIELARGIDKFANFNIKLVEQKDKKPSQVNFLRIALLVQIIQKLKSNYSEMFLKVMNTDKFLITETEKLLAFEILLNPLFRDILEKISRTDLVDYMNEVDGKEKCILF